MRTRQPGALAAYLVASGVLFLLPLSALGAEYYVATNGSDSSDGSIGSPWLTINHAVDNTGSGDTVYVRGGTYSENITIRGDQSEGGEDGNWWTLSAYQEEDAVIDGYIFVNSASYARISNLHLVDHYINLDRTTYGGLPRNHHIEVTGNRITGQQPQYGAIIAVGDDMIIENNTIIIDGGGGSLDHGIYLSEGENNVVRGNYVDNAAGYGIHLYVRTFGFPEPHLMTGATVENNYVTNSRLLAGYTISSGETSGIDGVSFRNNISYNNAAGGLLMHYVGAHLRNIDVYNNTFYEDESGIQVGSLVSSNVGIDSIAIRNNIVYVANASYRHLFVGSGATNISEDHNIYWPTPERFYGITRDSTSPLVDPLLANPGIANFHLQAGSPAIDTGATIAAVATDYEGNTRPIDGDSNGSSYYDVGAYEYTGVPYINTVTPADNATSSSVSDDFTIVFSEPVSKTGTGYITIYKSSDNSVVEQINVATGAVTGSGTDTITINPVTTLDDETSYYVKIDAMAFYDADGNNFGGISDASTWNFTTGDFSAPTLSSTTPADNATGVSTTTNLTIVFDESIGTTGTGYVTIYTATGDTVVEQINVATGAVTGSGTDTITINPSTTLSYSTAYYVQIDGMAFPDAAGNFYGGISDTTSWSFTTEMADVTPPSISTLTPTDNAIAVSPTSNLTIHFDESIGTTGTGYITIYKSSDDSVVEQINVATGAVTGSGTDTITINPVTTLDDETSYYVKIDAMAFPDEAGNSFTGITDATTWNFTTALAAAGNWLSGFTYRKQIVVDHTYVDGGLTNFPLYVHIENDTDMGTNARSNGYDIRFTTSTGNLTIPYERESWTVSSGSGSGDFWVKVPRVSSGSYTSIYLYYGSGAAVDGENTTGVWGGGFDAVWHLQEAGNGTSGEYAEATGNSHEGTGCGGVSGNTPALATGIVGSGQNFGAGDYIATANDETLIPGPTTYSVWVKPGTPNTSYNAVFDFNGSTASSPLLSTRLSDGAPRPIYFAGSSNYRYFANAAWTLLSDGNWHHVALTVPGISQSDVTNVTLHIDGVSQSVYSTTSSGLPSAFNGFWISKNTSSYSYLGLADEVRVSPTRSAEWLKFEYYNVSEADNDLNP